MLFYLKCILLLSAHSTSCPSAGTSHIVIEAAAHKKTLIVSPCRWNRGTLELAAQVARQWKRRVGDDHTRTFMEITALERERAVTWV